MRLRVKIAISTLLMLVMTMMFSVTALADSVDDVGGTGQGDIGGTNVYTFSYIYDASDDAIKLKVDTKNPLSSFGNTTSHTFSAGDTTTLHTKNPRLGNSLENAIASMNAAGGYNLSVDYVKSALNAHGYYDKGNGIWITDGGYLTYISAVKVRPQTHTVTYNANGGSGAPGNQTKTQGVTLTLSSTKPTRTGYTFKYWNASIGGTYSPGGSYTHDQNGGTVTMTAYWKDETAPSCSSFSAIPNSWSSGNGTATVTSKDRLIYVSKTEVPESIVFERFADYGYTIGISNMIQDSGGHYYFEYAVSDEEDYKYYIDTKSDASQLTELEVVTKVYLDKVGKIKVNEDSVSEGGTVLGLKKDKQYVCEFYTGTYYQDFLLTANIHSFGSMERFVSYNYVFMHSTFIVIEIPEYFKSGYYFVNGVGLFRYVADSDVGTYNGKAYDEAIDWNDPIIIYDENGEVIYDPSQPDYYKDKYSESDPGISDEELGLEPEPTIEEVD